MLALRRAPLRNRRVASMSAIWLRRTQRSCYLIVGPTQRRSRAAPRRRAGDPGMEPDQSGHVRLAVLKCIEVAFNARFKLFHSTSAARHIALVCEAHTWFRHTHYAQAAHAKLSRERGMKSRHPLVFAGILASASFVERGTRIGAER
jgi:hypothetical protein